MTKKPHLNLNGSNILGKSSPDTPETPKNAPQTIEIACQCLDTLEGFSRALEEIELKIEHIQTIIENALDNPENEMDF